MAAAYSSNINDVLREAIAGDDEVYMAATTFIGLPATNASI
jgi:hypothetical protein